MLESPTWRANPRWAAEIGYSDQELDQLNRKPIAVMEELGDRYESKQVPIVISGCVGPQGDGYRPEELLSAEDAQDYHSTQIATFSDTAADMVAAITMTYADEAVGVTRAAAEADMRVAISFTVETAGRLPSRQALGEATELDEGNPEDLGARYTALRARLAQLNVLGRCCGTDHRHVREIAEAWSAPSMAGAG